MRDFAALCLRSVRCALAALLYLLTSSADLHVVEFPYSSGFESLSLRQIPTILQKSNDSRTEDAVFTSEFQQ